MGEENSALGISMRLFQNPEIDELKRRTEQRREPNAKA